jgi:hypothetical protein
MLVKVRAALLQSVCIPRVCFTQLAQQLHLRLRGRVSNAAPSCLFAGDEAADTCIAATPS